MSEIGLELNPSQIPAWDGAAGDFVVVSREDARLDLQRPPGAGLALWAGLMAGHGLLELGAIAGLVLGVVPAWLAVSALIFLAPFVLVFLNGLRGELPTALRLDGEQRRVWGTQREKMTTAGIFWTRNGGATWVPAAQATAILLDVQRTRPETGTGRTSRASLSVALDAVGSRQLVGPRSAEKAELAWADARAELLPLGLELARRLGVPLRVRHLGWPGVRAPIERELRP